MRRSAPLLAAALALCCVPVRASDGIWSAVAPPNGRLAPSFVHDPIANSVLLFGGYDGFRLADTWALELDGAPSWQRVVPGGVPPSARYRHATVADPVRERMLVLCGDDGSLRADVWALSLGASRVWSEISTAGAGPSPRAWPVAVHDPARDRIVMFGGNDGALRNDVWILSFGGTPAWTPIFPAGTPPSPRERHTAVWDAAGDRLLVFGGDDGDLRADVWALSFAGSPAWTELTPAGSSPTPRSTSASIVDAIDGRWILFGGFDGAHRADVWEGSLDGPFAWTELSPAGGPTGRSWHAVAHDAVAQRMIVFGGAEGSLQLPADAWALSLSGPAAWSDLAPNPPPPTGRMAHSAVVDELGRRMIVFAGLGATNDVWALSLDDGAWTPLEPSGAPPGARADHAAVLDPARQRMLVFGGDFTNELWELALDGPPAWTELAPGGPAPSGRDSHTMVHDAALDRMIVFGGHNGSGFVDDVWELALAPSPEWSPITTTGVGPSARRDHVAVFDPVADRMLVFGGWGGFGFLNDTWQLDFSGGGAVWSELLPAGPLPEASITHAGAWDSRRGRFVTFGGSYHNRAWELTFDGGPAWHELAAADPKPSGRVDHTTIYDALGDRLVVFGGHSGLTAFLDAWVLGFDEPVGAPAAPAFARDAVRFAPPRPNPSSGATFFELSVPAAGHVRLSVYDAAGRLVSRVLDAAVPAGSHAISWSGADRGGKPVAPGVYFVELRAAGERHVRRVAVRR
jgi:hypothetical protein